MRRNAGVLTVLLASVVGAALVWVGNHAGLWWGAVLVGLVIGLLLRGTGVTLGAATVAGAGGWGLDLFWQSFHTNIGGAASVVAGIVGFGVADGFLVILVTCIFGWLLSLAGAWVGAALRRIVVGWRGYTTSAPVVGQHASAGGAVLSHTQMDAPPGAAPTQTAEDGAQASG